MRFDEICDQWRSIYEKNLPLILVPSLILVVLAICNFGKPATSYQKGSLSDTGFESEYLDLRFTLPDGFVMATEEELQALLEQDFEQKALIAQSTLPTGRLRAARGSNNTDFVYEMKVTAANWGVTVTVCTEIRVYETTEQYFAGTKQLLQRLSDYNYTTDDEITTVEIAGYSYEKMTFSTVVHGYRIIQKQLVRTLDNRVVVFTITSMSGTDDELDTLMAGFSQF